MVSGSYSTILDPYRGGGTGAVQAAMEHPRAVWGEELGGGELLGHLAPAAALLPEHGGHFVSLLLMMTQCN